MCIEKKLSVLKILKKYGRAEIVGSVMNRLIIAKDLDIHLLTSFNLKMVANEVYSKLDLENINLHMEIEDLQDIKNSVYICIKDYYDWRIDIWITNNIKFAGFDMVEELRSELDNKKRQIIMELKEYYYKKNLLFGEMSTIIYKAVLKDNVENIDDFKKYLGEIGKV